jgi:hypothetical protein
MGTELKPNEVMAPPGSAPVYFEPQYMKPLPLDSLSPYAPSLAPIPDNEKTKPVQVSEYVDYLQYSSLSDQMDEDVEDIIKTAAGNLAKTLAENVADEMQKALAALNAATKDAYPAQYKPQQTSLFEVNHQPADQWGYAVEYQNVGYVAEPEWYLFTDGKNVYHTRKQAWGRIKNLRPAYANAPCTVNFRVRPVFLGYTWRDKVENALRARRRKQTALANARKLQMAAALEAKYNKAYMDGGEWVSDKWEVELDDWEKPKQPLTLEVLPAPYPNTVTWAAKPGMTLWTAPELNVNPMVPPDGKFVSGNAVTFNFKTATGVNLAQQATKALANSNPPLSKADIKKAVYSLQKASELYTEMHQYAVQPVMVVHPKWLEQMEKLGDL